jgi:uncharacterized membrane protein YjgN (DUF898 family)
MTTGVADFGGRDGLEQAQDSQDESEERELRFQFTGDASEYFRIWIVNIALSIVTLGIYSAWAKVRTKKYLYRHTLLDGSAFDYLADPRKVLKGRLIVGAFILLMFGAQQVSSQLYIGLAIALALLTPAIFALATAFNARNSSYRNVRFSFQGSIGDSYNNFVAGLLICLVTFGLGFPALQCRVTKFFVGRHVYGLEHFRFHAKSGRYFRVHLGAMMWAMLIGFPTLILALLFGNEARFIVTAPVYFVTLAYTRAATANLVFNSTTIGPHRLFSTQHMEDLAKLYFIKRARHCG